MRAPLVVVSTFIAAAAVAGIGCSDEPKACGEEGGPRCAIEQPQANRPELFCPGQPGCELGPDDQFLAGAAARDITPKAFEIAREDYLEPHGDCASGKPTCGELIDLAFKDCGTDRFCPGERKCGTDSLCPDDSGYPGPDADGSERVWPGPDADGSERDKVLDFFDDCGTDRICPGAPGYTGPDADGSEGNGRFDGFWIAGFSPNRPMQEVHDPIWARAFAVKNGDVTLALVSLDVVGLFYEKEVVAIREKVKALGVEVDYVYVSATHNHEGPDTMGQWGILNTDYGIFRGVNEAWLDVVTTEAAQAVADAVAGMKPAKARVAIARTGLDGWVRDSRDPVIYDDRISLLQMVEKDAGATIGTLFVYSSHPEALSSGNNALTSDFVHYVRESFEKGLPAAGAKAAVEGVGGVTVFVNGALGGLIGPLGIRPTARDGREIDARGTFEKAQVLGENIAEAALLALKDGRVLEGTDLPLTVRANTFKMPVENLVLRLGMDGFGLFTRNLHNLNPETGDRNIRTEIGIAAIGPVTLVGMPGEMFPEMTVGFDEKWAHGKPRLSPGKTNPPDLGRAPQGPYLLDLFGGEYAFPLGLTNDELGYFVPSYDYVLHPQDPYFSEADGDHYEETNGLGPTTMDRLLEEYGKLAAFQIKAR